MNKTKPVLDTKPVYCKECRSHNTFVRNEAKDVTLENDETHNTHVGWESYKCSVCSHTALRYVVTPSRSVLNEDA